MGSEATIRRTWPCGTQESVHVRYGWFQAIPNPTEDDKPRLCIQHGPDCPGKVVVKPLARVER